MPEKVVFGWSGGKDSTSALYEVRKSRDYEVISLLTAIREDYDRVSLHGVRRSMIERQAECLGLPLYEVFVSQGEFTQDYESKMMAASLEFRNKGITSVVFGDIFFADIRKYREENLAKIGMKGIFPLWEKNSAELVRAFIDSGFRAITTCVDSKVLDKTFVGRIIDKDFLAELPANADPCGENGEFHSFVFDGPIFKTRVRYTTGEIVLRDSFYFCDLLPA